MRRHTFRAPRRGDRGVSLVVVLMILVVVSVLGIGSSQVAMLGEHWPLPRIGRRLQRQDRIARRLCRQHLPRQGQRKGAKPGKQIGGALRIANGLPHGSDKCRLRMQGGIDAHEHGCNR